MSKEKFSSGKWVVYIGHVSLNCGFVSVCCGDKTVYGREMYKSTEIESIANAYLIAAAPEMYEEIESDLADLVYDLEYCEPVYEHQIEKLKSKINQKTKLLAKARGETNE